MRLFEKVKLFSALFNLTLIGGTCRLNQVALWGYMLVNAFPLKPLAHHIIHMIRGIIVVGAHNANVTSITCSL